jgi:prolyl-tRNA synthetase
MAYQKNSIPKKSENISDWYNRVVLEAKLADYGPSKGTMIFMPYGYAIWELVQKEMDKAIKAHGVDNAYFPLFIPESLLKKEKEHVEGFAPELAIVTMGGGKELEEKLVVRPTSETIMYDSYSKWISSWRDLPMLINQWNNVVRWEKRTYLFLRTAEFLWQEGHTAHATHEEAYEMVEWAMDMYANTYRELYAIAGYVGKKSESEKFAGAVTTLTYESLMPDGKALQSCTSHDLGQNFSKPFNIKFQDKDGESKYVWQTSWGFSTRSLGGVVLAHGDDNGLKLPPRIAPTQVIILPISDEHTLVAQADKLKEELEKLNIRVRVDAREDETIGYRINKWELKGVPIIVELGKKELQEDTVTIVKRLNGEKSTLKTSAFIEHVFGMLEEIQKEMLKASEEHLKANTFEAETYQQFKHIMETTRGFISAFWCENPECEKNIKDETKATTRCLPLNSKEQNGKCVYCGGPAKHRWIFAQAY